MDLLRTNADHQSELAINKGNRYSHNPNYFLFSTLQNIKETKVNWICAYAALNAVSYHLEFLRI